MLLIHKNKKIQNINLFVYIFAVDFVSFRRLQLLQREIPFAFLINSKDEYYCASKSKTLHARKQSIIKAIVEVYASGVRIMT